MVTYYYHGYPVDRPPFVVANANPDKASLNDILKEWHVDPPVLVYTNSVTIATNTDFSKRYRDSFTLASSSTVDTKQISLGSLWSLCKIPTVHNMIIIFQHNILTSYQCSLLLKHVQIYSHGELESGDQ